MKTYNREKPLISIHIPKCAGSSFSKVLKTWFKGKYCRHYPDEINNKPPEKHDIYTGFWSKKLRPGICIHGHFNNNRGNGVYDYYPEADQFITILRDPFDLHVSIYFYVRRRAKIEGGVYWAGKPHPIIENNWNIEIYLRENKKSYICQFLPPNLTLDNYQQVLEDQFVFVGISEELQHSVDLLANKLGFPSIPVHHTNVSTWDEPIPDNARGEFAENNPLEVAIYNYVKNNWENIFSEEYDHGIWYVGCIYFCGVCC